MTDLTTWTPVGQSLKSDCKWRDIEGAPMPYQAARKAFDRGDVLMATRFLEDRRILLVKRRVAQKVGR